MMMPTDAPDNPEEKQTRITDISNITHNITIYQQNITQ